MKLKYIRINGHGILVDENAEIKEGNFYYNYDYKYIKKCVDVDKQFVKNALLYEQGSTIFDYSKDCNKIV